SAPASRRGWSRSRRPRPRSRCTAGRASWPAGATAPWPATWSRPFPLRSPNVTPERALARVDLGAIRRNAETLRRAAGRAELLAVVKAFGYGHRAVPVARAALEGGATRLGVAAIEAAEGLGEAGIGAPIVCWGPLMGHEWRRAAAAAADVAVWTPEACRAAADAGAVRVHLKLDSGMGRLGARPEDVAALAEAAAEPRLDVAGIMTHFATADGTGGEDAGVLPAQLPPL